MVSVVYCTREENPKHKEHLIKKSGIYKQLEVIEIVNNGESLTKAYNRGLKQATNDIVVFCHDDITFDKGGWAKKLIKHYETTDYGILGVAGTKYLSETGRWWDKRKSMYGRVRHTSDGKSWMSKYSPDLANEIEDVIVVDGVFFSVHKKRLKKDFDESVEGFHFYDVDFCFQNYLEGVKVGVHTNVKVNHQSIGETNDKWEENRVTFTEKYKEDLPVKIDKVFKGNEKFKVLLASVNVNDSIDLAVKLKSMNHNVTVLGKFEQESAIKLHRKGIKFAPMEQPPGYMLGDGKWTLKTPDGDVVSKPNQFYKIGEADFDILHLKEGDEAAAQLARFYPDMGHVTNDEVNADIITKEYQTVLT